MTMTIAEKIAEYQTPPQVADVLGVGHDKILVWIHSGELRAIDVSTTRGQRPRWRISRIDLEDFLKRRAAIPRSPRRVKKAKKVIGNGSEQLLEAVEQDEVTLNQATKLIDAEPDKKKQTTIVMAGKEAIKNATGTKPKTKAKAPVNLPDEPTESDIAVVDQWIESQDERPAFERFKALWDSADDTGRAAIRAFVLEN